MGDGGCMISVRLEPTGIHPVWQVCHRLAHSPNIYL